jgi:hypothetical protein
LEAEFPLDARVTLSSFGLRDSTKIAQVCSRPLCHKLEIQHDKKKEEEHANSNQRRLTVKRM